MEVSKSYHSVTLREVTDKNQGLSRHVGQVVGRKENVSIFIFIHFVAI